MTQSDPEGDNDRVALRILLAVPKYPFPIVGGLEKQAHELGKGLVGQGHSVYALSTRFDPSQAYTAIIDGVHVRRVNWIESKPLRFLVSPFAILRCLRSLKNDIDVVHVHNISWFGAFICLIAKSFGLPVIVKLPTLRNIQRIRSRLGGSALIAVLRRSDAIVAMTPESIAELLGLAFPAEKILRVPNGISPFPEGLTERRQIDGVTAIFVGRLFPEKGLADLLAAWSIVQTHSPTKARLRIVGTGPMDSECKALVREMNMESTVAFVGHSADVPSELNNADIFVLPSHAEGNSNAVLEAMRAGLPIVATAVGGTPMQVGPQGRNFLVPPRKPSLIAERLAELIADPQLRSALGEQMRQRVRTEFNSETIAKTYAQAYRLLASQRSRDVGSLNSHLFERG